MRKAQLVELLRDVFVEWINQSVRGKTVAGASCKATEWALAEAALLKGAAVMRASQKRVEDVPPAAASVAETAAALP